MAPNTLFHAAVVLAWTSLVSAHSAIWHPSMWGFNQSNTNRPQDPLMNLPFEQWWFHGHLDYPPHPDDIMQLPVGENTTIEISCDKDATSYWTSGPGGNQQSLTEPDSPCPGQPTTTFHANNITDLGGCALAVAYKSDVSEVQPEDFVVFSVNHQCVWNLHTNFSVPADMPPCPNGKCICMFNWIHLPDSGSEQMYFNGFQCNFENAKSNKTLGPSQLARRCGPEEANNNTWNYSNCTYGPKQPIYWLQLERNNMFEGYYSPPLLNDLYNFRDGAQNDIFVGDYNTSYTSNSTASPSNSTAPASNLTVPTGQPSQTSSSSSSMSPQGAQPSSGASSPVAQPSASVADALAQPDNTSTGVPQQTPSPTTSAAQSGATTDGSDPDDDAPCTYSEDSMPAPSQLPSSPNTQTASPESTSDPAGQPDSSTPTDTNSPTPTDGPDPSDDDPCTDSGDSTMPTPTPSSSDPSDLSPSSSLPSPATQTAAADNSTSTSTPDPAAPSPSDTNDVAILNNGTGTSTDSGTGMPTATAECSDRDPDGSNGNSTKAKRQAGRNQMDAPSRRRRRRSGQPRQIPSSSLSSQGPQPSSGTSSPVAQPSVSATGTLTGSGVKTHAHAHKRPTTTAAPVLPTAQPNATTDGSDPSVVPCTHLMDMPAPSQPPSSLSSLPPLNTQTASPESTSDPAGQPDSVAPTPTDGSDPYPSQYSPSSSSPLLVTPTTAADNSASTPDGLGPATPSPSDATDAPALSTGTSTDSSTGTPTAAPGSVGKRQLWKNKLIRRAWGAHHRRSVGNHHS